ncbi:MAG: hypothetical protein AAGI14_05485 [Pseudomonadota bacterium]
MMIGGLELFAIVGFLFAAYAVIANDSIQTLGTFLASNSHRPWWVLWIFAAGIMVAALIFQLFYGGGDIADGKLNGIPYPEGGIKWWHAVLPLVLLFLTRFGIPVSTTFLVLTVFALTGGAATEGKMQSMLIKSLIGYAVAFAAGGVIWLVISKAWETWITRTKNDGKPHPLWSVFQWATTGFLWWTWLLQDFANIFVFFPRTTETINTTMNADGVSVTQVTTIDLPYEEPQIIESSRQVVNIPAETLADAEKLEKFLDPSISVSFIPGLIIFGALVMAAMLAYVFATRGGEIQKIVLAKTNTVDVRAATIVDLIYAIVLYYFKELNDVPMSTTWVFLGLLAGRELAISFVTDLRERGVAALDVGSDAGKALIGLVISVVLAVGLPWAATGNMPTF